MSGKKVKITLAGEEYEVSKLNFGQLEEIIPLVVGMKAAELGLSKIITILGIMLSDDYPDLVVKKLPADIKGGTEAVMAILRHSDLELKAASPGEAPAGVKA